MSTNNPKNKLLDFETTIYQSSRKKDRKNYKKQTCAIFCFKEYFQGKV